MSIMNFTKTMLKNMGSKPATLMYPMKKRDFYERTRGHIEIRKEDCIFCSICAKKCPTHSIEVNRAEKLWSIDRLKCIQCNACAEHCPKKCLTMKNEYTDPSHGQVKDEF